MWFYLGNGGVPITSLNLNTFKFQQDREHYTLFTILKLMHQKDIDNKWEESGYDWDAMINEKELLWGFL